jgi:hypothetical protein
MSGKKLSIPALIKNDPFLRAFCVNANARIFDISGFFSPISIKDQLIRACWLIEKVLDLEIISKDAKLLIVGAGPAGIAAAITAKSKGIKDITIIEKTKAVAEVLNTASRNIDFVQYDWAAEHWQAGIFPLSGIEGIIPFVLNSNKPRNAKKIIEKARYKSGIAPFHEIVIEKVEPKKGKVKVQFKPASNPKTPIPSTSTFDMALSCIGYGLENVQVKKSKFRAYEFWRMRNHLEYRKNFEQKILICGGGDGALQDFLLLATNKNMAKDIYRGLDLPAKLKAEIEKNIFRIEERLKRKEVWLDKESPNYFTESCELYSRLQKVHLNQVRKVLKNARVMNNLKKMLTKLVLNGNLNLTFFCNHFSACYPLNRFLVLLISEYLTTQSNNPVLSSCKVDKITSAEKIHKCNLKEDDCAKYKHKVIFSHRCKCDSEIACKCVPKPAVKTAKIFDKIIIRFGIDRVNPIFGRPPALPGMQILPYSLP